MSASTHLGSHPTASTSAPASFDWSQHSHGPTSVRSSASTSVRLPPLSSMYDGGFGPAHSSGQPVRRHSPYEDSRPLPPPVYYPQPYYGPPGFSAPYPYSAAPPHLPSHYHAPPPPSRSPIGYAPAPGYVYGAPAYDYGGDGSIPGHHYMTPHPASAPPSSAAPWPAPLDAPSLHSRASGFPSAPLSSGASVEASYGAPSGGSGEERDVKSKRQYRKKTPPSACAACGATGTPEWRKGPTGNRTLCNACGIQAQKLFPQQPKTAEEAREQLRKLSDARRQRKGAGIGGVAAATSPSLASLPPPMQQSWSAGATLPAPRPIYASDPHKLEAAISLQSMHGRDAPLPGLTIPSLPSLPTATTFHPHDYNAPSSRPRFGRSFTSNATIGASGSSGKMAFSELMDPSLSPRQTTQSQLQFRQRSSNGDAGAQFAFAPDHSSMPSWPPTGPSTGYHHEPTPSGAVGPASAGASSTGSSWYLRDREGSRSSMHGGQ